MPRSQLYVCLSLLLVLTIPTFLNAQQTGDTQWTEAEPMPGQWLVLRAGYRNAHTKVLPNQAILDKRMPKTASFIVTYNGFSPAAQAAFQHAVDIWGQLITSPVPIRVQANWTPLDPGILGGAGTNNLWTDGVHIFPDALADALSGADLGGGDFDILAEFNSDLTTWYFGTDANTPAGRDDFVTTVLHEIGHGLGFSGLLTVDQGVGFLLTSLPMIYDAFAEDASGNSLLNPAFYPDLSTQLAAALQGGDVFFDGPMARAANGGNRPELFAPSQWIQGSSYSHLDETAYPPGNLNSLMTPFLDFAEAIHDPGPVTLCMFQDMGWTTDHDCESVQAGCTPNATTMCLNGGRFQVKVDWRNFEGVPGTAKVVPFGSDDSGLFYFFNPDNWEMLIKVIDACGFSNNFWVFAAATTNVEYTITVTDTKEDVVRTYTNPLGRAAPAITDTEAFATCP